MTDIEDDLDADLRKALSEGTQELETTIVDPANEDPVELPNDPQQKTGNEVSEGENARERGPDGKFVAKAAEVVQDAPVQDPNAPAEPSQSAIRPPASWTPEAKSQFASLSPAVQAAIAKREQEIDQGLRAKAREVQRYEPLEQVIAPHRQKWAVAGVDEATAIKQLLAASDWLDRDPAQAIAYLANQYGVSGQTPAGQPQAQPQTVSQAPEFTALQRELAELKQQIATQSESGLVSQIEAFKNNPANIYYENVREDMATLLAAGKAANLEEAYDMACWMRPDIRPFLQKVQSPAPDPTAVARKKTAAGSVTGSPAEPTAALLNGNGSIEDDIRAAILESAGR